jgi:hypothetical protein
MTLKEAQEIKDEALEVLSDPSMAGFHNIARKDLAEADKVLQGSKKDKRKPASTKKRGRAAAFSTAEKPARNKKPTRKTAQNKDYFEKLQEDLEIANDNSYQLFTRVNAEERIAKAIFRFWDKDNAHTDKAERLAYDALFRLKRYDIGDDDYEENEAKIIELIADLRNILATIDRGIATEKKTTAKPKTKKQAGNTAPKTGKQTATKKTDKAEKPTFSGSEVANFSAEQTFFIKVLAANGKQKTKEELATMLRGYNKAAIAQLIRAKSPNAKLLQEIATNLQAVYIDLQDGEAMKVTFSAETLAKLNAFGKNQLQKMPSVALLTTFVNYQDKSPKKETAAKWVKSAKKIAKTDNYFAQIQQAIDSVEVYLAGGTKAVILSVSQLRGLGALGFLKNNYRQGEKPLPKLERKMTKKNNYRQGKKATAEVGKRLGCVDTQDCKPYWDKRSSTHDESGLPYFMSSKELLATKYEVLPMSDYWTKIFGDLPAEGRFNIAFSAKKGLGKTTLAMNFAKYFANQVGSVLYLSYEQFGSAGLKKQAEQNGIISEDNITWCGSVDLLKDLSKISPNQYKLIIIDSTTDANVSKEMFESYLQKHNQTSFVAILRKSQHGTDMGADANFITGKVDVVVEFREEGNEKFAFWVKNRLANAKFLEENEVRIEMPK